MKKKMVFMLLIIITSHDGHNRLDLIFIIYLGRNENCRVRVFILYIQTNLT